MERVIVIRTFAEPVSFEEVDCHEKRVAWCLETNRVKALGSFFSKDRRRMICVYEAPDAEAVRRTQDEGQLPYDVVFSASVHGHPI